jgi:hypothetical protein
VDSILIDEARTPLIISGQAHEDQPRYELADQLARHLVEKQKPVARGRRAVQQCKMRIKGLEGDIRQARDKSKVPSSRKQLPHARPSCPKLEAERDSFTQYYEVQLERKQCHLTHDGVAEAQRVAGVGSFYVDENMDLPHLLEQSLRAHAVYQRDRDYVVMPAPDPQTGRTEPSVVIVDVNTGRPMIGRQWSDGLHQAVECKEGADQAGDADGRDDHDPELLQDVQAAGGHDGHGRHRGAGVPRHLQARRGGDPDQQAGGPARLRRHGVPDRQGQVERDRRRDQGTSTTWGARSSSAPPASRRARCSARC